MCKGNHFTVCNTEADTVGEGAITTPKPERRLDSLPESWTPQERWVWEQVNRGVMADLEQISRDQIQRLSASFLQDLIVEMASSDQALKRGLHIKNALIDGQVNLSDF